MSTQSAEERRPVNAGPSLSIGAVATATHVSVAALRAWEQRFGFPVPERGPGGHRRYSPQQVEQVKQVLRDRDAGWSLEAAIHRAREHAGLAASLTESSVFAGLRRRRPDLQAYDLTRESMLAISHAIEDEFCARAEHPVLIGAFQHVHRYRTAAARWGDLARTASLTIIFADFPNSRVRQGEPSEIALPNDAALRREWIVVCDAPEGAACLAGIERPRRRNGDRGRMFEAVWSFDPAVVRVATEVGLALAKQYAPRAVRSFNREQLPPPTDCRSALRRASALISRIIAYLER
jgi:DICT domain-containing protein